MSFRISRIEMDFFENQGYMEKTVKLTPKKRRKLTP